VIPTAFSARPPGLADKLAPWAMIAAIGYGPLIVAIAAFFELRIQTFPLIFIPATLLITVVLLVFHVDRTRNLAPIPGGWLLALFLVALIATTLRADIAQVRYDRIAMWRQLFLACLPIMLYWGARTWAVRSFSVEALDRGAGLLLAVSGASIGLEMLGFARYEAFGARYFGFVGDQVAWLLSFLAIYYFVRGKLIFFALCLMVLFATLSRGALVVVGIGVAFHLLFSPMVDTRSFVMRFGALLIGAAGFFLFQDTIGAFMERFYGLDLLENDRTRTIAFTLRVFDLSPIFGSGYNAHTYFFRPIAPAVNYAQVLWATPVSTWAQILADGGIVTFIPFFMWALHCVWTAFRTLRVARGDPEARALMGLAAWFVAYVPFNHTAAWLLPSSLLSPLVFVVAGVVMGRSVAFLHSASPMRVPYRAQPVAVARSGL
jgi:O-antigen ligase